MLKLAANIDWLFTDLPVTARFEAAKHAGFHGIEGLFLCQHPLDELCAIQRETALPVVLLNAPAGHWQRGERGLAAQAGRKMEFLQSLTVARDYACALDCRLVHVMAGHRNHEISVSAQCDLFIERLQIACEVMAAAGITVVIEPLNSEDMPGYFLDSFPLAENIIKQVAKDNIGLQFDIYHCQKRHGNIIRNLEYYWPIIRHIQIASVPERHEPGTGELDDTRLLTLIDRLGYQGWIGCEYSASNQTSDATNWMTMHL